MTWTFFDLKEISEQWLSNNHGGKWELETKMEFGKLLPGKLDHLEGGGDFDLSHEEIHYKMVVYL